LFPLSPRRVLARGSERAGATCKAHPFSLRAHQEDGLVYLRIAGDFDRSAVGWVQCALATLPAEPPRRVVFDLSGVTFMDLAALTTLVRADERGRREDFEVVVVRPLPVEVRLFAQSRAVAHLTLVNLPRTAEVPEHGGGPVGPEGRAAAIEFRSLPTEEVFTCVRCRGNPAVVAAGQAPGGLTLVSADGPICGGCITKLEQIEMGEAILGDLRRGQPRDEAKITELEKALTELRDSEPAD
jgi:anti-anti-sigma factor